MPSSYTTSLRLTLPATGELSGQWGNTVNTGITELLDAAVAGTASISTWGGAGVAYTLSNNSGTADEARRMFIVATGAPGEAKNVVCPAVSKFYVLRNDTTGGFALTLKTPSGSGISVPAGQYKFLYCNGTDVVEMFNSAGALTLSGALSVGGTTTLAGNPTLSAGTANQVQFLNASKVLTGSANLTFDGTSLTLGANPTLSAGTANGVAYANASKVLTTGTALTFDGTGLGVGAAPLSGIKAYFAAQSGNNTVRLDCGPGGASISDLTFGAYGFSAVAGLRFEDANALLRMYGDATRALAFNANGSEQMRLTSTGLGIGTSSPGNRLHVNGSGDVARFTNGTQSAYIALDSGGYSLLTGAGQTGNGIYASATTNAVQLFTSGTAKATLDASGNLGLGVTPSASGTPTLEVGTIGSGISGRAINTFSLAQNAYNNAGWKYAKGTWKSALHEMQDGNFYWFTAPSGTAGNAISFTQAMTLDASSRLALNGTDATVGGGQMVVNHAANNGLVINQTGSGTGAQIYLRNAVDGTINGINFTNSGVRFYDISTATERARITSGGYFKASNTGTYISSSGAYHELYVDGSSADWTARVTSATATAANAFGIRVSYTGAGPNGTTNDFLFCIDNAATRATIRSNGGLANYSGNNVNLSDRREKTNFAPAKSYLDTICAIPVQTFEYIDQSEDDPGLTLGVVAQDVQAVAPELVMESNWGTADEPKQRLSIYQTDLQYALMKCVQELKAQNDELRARVAALESN